MFCIRVWREPLVCLIVLISCITGTEIPALANQTENLSVLNPVTDESSGDLNTKSGENASIISTTQSSIVNSTDISVINETSLHEQNSTVGNVVTILASISTTHPDILSTPNPNTTLSSTVVNLSLDNQTIEESTTGSVPQLDSQHSIVGASSLPPTVPVAISQEDNGTTQMPTEMFHETSSIRVPNKSLQEIRTEPETSLVHTSTSLYGSASDTSNEQVTTTASGAMGSPSTTPPEDMTTSAHPFVSAHTDIAHTLPSGFPASSEASFTIPNSLGTTSAGEPEYTSTDSKSPTLPSSTKISKSSLFILQFIGNTFNCSTEKQYNDLEKQVRDILLHKTGVPTHKLSLNVVNCSKSFFMNVGVSKEYETNVSEFLKKLEVNSTQFTINDATYHLNILTTAIPVNSDAHRQPPQVVLSSRHTNIEFVIYVALGSACAFLLTLAVVLVSCKYCRTKPYKSFDLNDVSHLSHRLEDYSLRQIPRPKSVYVDYCRRLPAGNDHYSPLEEQASNGMVHAFDTSVVPLEDVPMKLAEEETTHSPLRNKDGQISGKTTNHEYEEIDMKAVNSTENLHKQQANQKAAATPWGVDNDSFMT